MLPIAPKHADWQISRGLHHQPCPRPVHQASLPRPIPTRPLPPHRQRLRPVVPSSTSHQRTTFPTHPPITAHHHASHTSGITLSLLKHQHPARGIYHRRALIAVSARSRLPRRQRMLVVFLTLPSKSYEHTPSPSSKSACNDEDHIKSVCCAAQASD